MSSASARPQPAECVTQIAWASQRLRAAALSPSSGKPSGVNDISPLNARVISMSRSAGSRRPASARARGEVVRGEGQLRGALGLGQARLVAVVADRVAVAHLAEVHRVVLVAQDRVHDLARLAGELGQRRGVGELVLDRHERHVEPGRQRRHPPAPDARGDDDVLGADGAERRLHADRAATLDDAGR